MYGCGCTLPLSEVSTAAVPYAAVLFIFLGLILHFSWLLHQLFLAKAHRMSWNANDTAAYSSHARWSHRDLMSGNTLSMWPRLLPSIAIIEGIGPGSQQSNERAIVSLNLTAPNQKTNRLSPHACSELSLRILLWNASGAQKHFHYTWQTGMGQWIGQKNLMSYHRHSQRVVPGKNRIEANLLKFDMQVLGLAGRQARQMKFCKKWGWKSRYMTPAPQSHISHECSPLRWAIICKHEIAPMQI